MQVSVYEILCILYKFVSPFVSFTATFYYTISGSMFDYEFCSPMNLVLFCRDRVYCMTAVVYGESTGCW